MLPTPAQSWLCARGAVAIKQGIDGPPWGGLLLMPPPDQGKARYQHVLTHHIMPVRFHGDWQRPAWPRARRAWLLCPHVGFKKFDSIIERSHRFGIASHVRMVAPCHGLVGRLRHF